ncbi:hypothetical protein KPH14_004851 [Odynerus spinipes]|uniref:Uncharacterized protein n=1 Tax=Odynerus spinipes TaxID=1348599 RepID=A0AAD9VQQ1_9HYME|nr:hypothetical protein KPH14_004851 [Odynerus spinipes]
MVTRSSLHGVIGYISRILSTDSAEIMFPLDGNLERVYLKKDKFYHNGRLIPQEEPLHKYIKCDMEVKFSCQILKKSEKHIFGWIALMCWPKEQTLGLSIDVKIGLQYISGRICNLQKDHGVLVTNDVAGVEYKVYFVANRFYSHGKRLGMSQPLHNVLSLNDDVFFDAVPCIPEENEYNCKWYATCVFKGKRPTLWNIIPEPSISNEASDRVLQIIESCFINPRIMFVIGKGILMSTLNNEFGIILGEFQHNIFKEVLFHRKNAFLFKMNLANYSLPEILKKGDRMKFIAIGAPPGFFVEWIAIQVSVCENGEYDIPKYSGFQLYSCNSLLPPRSVDQES